jgi:hypothetical protein
MENTVYERKADTRDELLQWVSDAARQVNSAAVLRKIACSVVNEPGYAPKLTMDILNNYFRPR